MHNTVDFCGGHTWFDDCMTGIKDFPANPGRCSDTLQILPIPLLGCRAHVQTMLRKPVKLSTWT